MKLVTIILTGIISISFLAQKTFDQVSADTNDQNQTQSQQIHFNDKSRNGALLDSARIYNSPDTIKKYIDNVHDSGGNYLQLHLTDDSNFGIENDYLHQTPTQNNYQKDGIYYSSITNKPFLTKAQLQDIVDYGKSRGVEIVIEIDVPGHAKAILKLMKSAGVNTKEMSTEYGDLNYHNLKLRSIIKNIFREYFKIIPQGSYIATGDDESTISDKGDAVDNMRFENSLNRYLNRHGYRMQIWNDGVQKQVLADYDKDILINYWSWSGDTDNKKDYTDNRKYRASLPEINKAGLKTINSYQYANYLILDSLVKNSKGSYRDFKSDQQHWNPRIWDDNSSELDKIKSNKDTIGTALSFWGESNDQFDTVKLQQSSQKYIKYYFDHLKQIHYLK